MSRWVKRTTLSVHHEAETIVEYGVGSNGQIPVSPDLLERLLAEAAYVPEEETP